MPYHHGKKKPMGKKKPKKNGKKKRKGLTAKQKKLPPALRAAILKRQKGKKCSRCGNWEKALLHLQERRPR